MHLERRVVGDYQILVAATPSSAGGFTAAVSVKSLASAQGDDIFSDYRLAKGFVFKDAGAALRYAFDVGHSHLRGQPVRA